MEEQKKDSLFWIKVILFSVIVIIISIAVLISTHASHQKNKEKLREYSDYLNSYLEENFPEQYSVETSGTVFTVHVWEPGTVLSDVEDETLIRDKYGKLAKQLWQSLEKDGLNLDYSVSVILHNDKNMDNILMCWDNGTYRKGD